MTRAKIDYGIDLGTTNSAIAVMNQGYIKIIKSDLQMDTSPSCVFFNKNQTLFVGVKAYSSASKESLLRFKNWSKEILKNYFIEFKRTMGTDESYFCNNMNRSFSSEELSAEVLKKMKSYVTDEEIKSVVITVPAKFEQHQVDATQRAAELAGFDYVELLQEPIAASMACGMDEKVVNGNWLVFDFGGGTFDVALMKVDEGIMQVKDTEGDNHLGGKNIDFAIVDHILIPWFKEHYELSDTLSDDLKKRLLQEALKFPAEEIKIALSSNEKYNWCPDEPFGEDDDGEEIEPNIDITINDFKEAVEPIFQRAIDISLKLLNNKNIQGADLETILLVGGPTLSQTFREMIKEQISEKINTDIDPMTCVARGAALFASTKDIPLDLQKRNRAKIQLRRKYPGTTVESQENVGIFIEREQTEGDIPGKIFIEIERSDKGWSSGKKEIEDDAEMFTIQIEEGKPNGFIITLYDEKGTMYPCEPKNFTIINGFTPPKATLPFDLCLNIFDIQKEREILDIFKGLEKNQSLPAKGKGIYRTQKDIRPGIKEDAILIDIYDGESGTSAIYNRPVGNIKINGGDIGEFLPKDSEVEITLEMDSSRRVTIIAYFPYIDDTVEKKLPEYKETQVREDLIETEIKKARQTLNMMEIELSDKDTDQIEKFSSGINEIADKFNNGKGDRDTKDEVIRRLREILREIDKIQDANQWPMVETELNHALDNISTTNERYGNENTAQIVSQFKQNAKIIIKDKNIELARELTKEIHALGFALVKEQTGLWISYIKDYDDDFETHDWKNKNIARQLINDAIDNINSKKPSKDFLEETVYKLFKLLPPTNEGFPDINDELLKK